MKKLGLANKILLCMFLGIIFSLFLINMKNILKIGIETFELNYQITYSRKQSLKESAKEMFMGLKNLEAGKIPLIELNGLFQKGMQKTTIEDVEENNEVTRLKNGYLTFTYPKYDVTNNANNLLKLNEKLSQKNIPLIYVQAPFKVSKYDSLLPLGTEDYSNENADKLVNLIKDKIDVIDIRDFEKEDNIDHYSMFFKTDHHWRPEFAFYAFGKVGEHLGEKYSLSFNKDYLDIEQYNIENYENYFLGSQGKRVGKYFSGVDDISLITPKFETNFDYKIPSYQIDKHGTFRDTLIDFSHVEKKDYYILNPYAMYTGGDFTITYTTNHLVKDKKLLLVKDSFACAFSPFISLLFHEVETVDLRQFKDKSLMEHIEDSNPDMVMFLYNPSEYTDHTTITFDFFSNNKE